MKSAGVARLCCSGFFHRLGDCFALVSRRSAQHPSVNPAEARNSFATTWVKRPHSEPIPWRAVLTNSGIWSLGLAIVCSSFNSYFYYSWFSSYLKEGRQIENQESGFMGSLVSQARCRVIGGGVVADRILRTTNVVRSRRILGGRVCAGG